jgi:hypothetical protein
MPVDVHITNYPITGLTAQELVDRYGSLGMTLRLARRLQSSALRQGAWPEDDSTISRRWLGEIRRHL